MPLLNVAIYDATIPAWDSKYAFNRPRPVEIDPSLAPVVATPNSPSYPSEHAAAAGAAAAILGYVMPQDAEFFADKAEEAARSRVSAGVQYPSDVRAGLELGRAVAARVIERAKTDGFDAKWDGKMPTGPGYWVGTNPNIPLAGTWKTWLVPWDGKPSVGPPPTDALAAILPLGPFLHRRRDVADARVSLPARRALLPQPGRGAGGVPPVGRHPFPRRQRRRVEVGPGGGREGDRMGPA
jgi:PAP2 superfamily